MPRIRAVVFDLGHTLWDFAPSEQARRLEVLQLQAVLERVMGPAAPSPVELGRALGDVSRVWFDQWSNDRVNLEQPPSDRFVQGALDKLGVNVSDELLAELTTVMFGGELELPVMAPDSVAAIDILDRRGVAMGCITNTVLLGAGIRDTLERLGLVRYLRSAVVSSEAGYRKPHPSLFRQALAELGVGPHEAVFVGDRLWDDVAGAQAAGMGGVLTHQYRQEPVDGLGVTPDAVIARLAELPDVIERLEAEQ